MDAISKLFKSNYSKVAVVGASGFIGKHLVAHLLKIGVKVFAPNRNLVPLKIGFSEIESPFEERLVKEIESFKPELIFNLATYFTRDCKNLDLIKLANAHGLLCGLIANYATKNDIRVVQAQSAWQRNEGLSRNAPTIYFLYKQIAEDIMEWFSVNKELSVGFINFFDTYGPNDTRDKLIPNLLSSALKQEKFDCSLGDQILELVFIDDAVLSLLATANSLIDSIQEPKNFWCRPDKPITLRDLINTLQIELEIPVSPNWGAKPYRSGEMFDRWHIPMKLPPLWTPKTSLVDGLQKTWNSIV